MGGGKKQDLVLSRTDALLIVDVQNDFLPGGSLAVPHGDEVIAPLNRYIHEFRLRRLPIIATRDWHPEKHCSFRAQGGPWPPHCVQDSDGARISPALHLPDDTVLISKGTFEDRDAYSGFQGTELESLLRAREIERLFIGGLATDYCVRQTVLDALERRFTVYLLSDAIRAVEVKPGDGEQALEAMRQAGAHAITLDSIS